MTAQLSRSAYDRLRSEFEDLTTRGRIEVAQKIEAARLLGDLRENGDYHAAKDEQGHMEGRIRQLEHILETAEIIENPPEGEVGPGTTLKFPTGETVAEILANPENYYVNVHNAEYPAGALRGQLAIGR